MLRYFFFHSVLFAMHKLHCLKQKIELTDMNTLGVTVESGDTVIVMNNPVSGNQSSVDWIKSKHKIKSLSAYLSQYPPPSNASHTPTVSVSRVNISPIFTLGYQLYIECRKLSRTRPCMSVLAFNLMPIIMPGSKITCRSNPIPLWTLL